MVFSRDGLNCRRIGVNSRLNETLVPLNADLGHNAAGEMVQRGNLDA